MRLTHRRLALFIVAGLLLACTACNRNKEKIVGKWKMESMTDKNGKEQKAQLMGITPIMEFTADGKVNFGVDLSNLPPEFKKKVDEDKEAAAKAGQMHNVGTYSVSGDILEIKSSGKDSESGLFGGKDKGRLKLNIDGDTMTITGDDGTVKLSRMK